MRVDMLQGTLDMLVLKALSLGPNHGYGVARWLESMTDDALRVEEGSLYPALHRMQKRGWIASQWGVSDRNRRAKYYALTREGQEQLREEEQTWQLFTSAVAKVMQSQPG